MGESKKDNRILKSLAAWVPTHVSGKIIVGIYHLLDTFNFIGKRIRQEHRTTNEEKLGLADSPLGDNFIENQHAWGNISFGNTTMAVSGCEIMAVYNIMKALGLGGGPGLISELISNFEKRGAALKGTIGSSPLAIRSFLKKKGIKSRLIWKNEKINEAANMAIVTYYNNKASLYHQIHTVAFIKDKELGFVPHNAWHSKPGYETLKEAMGAVGTDPKTICIIEIL